MSNKEKDPKTILKSAIDELDLFAQAAESRLEIGENGRLKASRESRLERAVGMARDYLGTFFFQQKRRGQSKKHGELKEAILNARDIIQSHSALIVKFKEGDESQKRLAEYALSAIHRYNALVSRDEASKSASYDVYNYERNWLLSDEEIKGRTIELPHHLSIKFDSHPDEHPAHKMFQEMRHTFHSAPQPKQTVSICPSHKKTRQFMIDTFHMKAIRMMQSHLTHQNSIADIVPMVKGTRLEIDEESNPEFITMRQQFDMGPGFFIQVSGCFKQHPTDPKFLAMPILDSFRLSFQMFHSGFPYPSQHTGWGLSDKWVDASPLRSDQTPLYNMADHKKKQLVQRLLYDQEFIQLARKNATLKREAFDQNKDLFLPLYRQLQQELRQDSLNSLGVVDLFMKQLEDASSPFDLLVQTEQIIQDQFVQGPIRLLQEEWLDDKPSPLRVGSPNEKFQAACERFDYYCADIRSKLDCSLPQYEYIAHQGILLANAFKSIGLQYLSEKIGFSPPLLSDFQRKLQMIAFQQLFTFMEECEGYQIGADPDQVKQLLWDSWAKDLKILRSLPSGEEHSPVSRLVDELEVYFNSRFYIFQPRAIEEQAV